MSWTGVRARIFVKVVIGIIINTANEVLIAKRPDHVYLGGIWEFPGGKVEANETQEVALKRELKEEIGINILQMSPLLQISHSYPDRDVQLDVWCIDSYEGNVCGAEGQEIRWVAIHDLGEYEFPSGNVEIVSVLRKMKA